MIYPESMFFFFFFQAEDGIRDSSVTGVQTCALPISFIMPERVAKTDPFKQITEYIGSGPMRFMKNEWVPGARAAFEKFSDYTPRSEPASWLAGGKRMLAERVAWVVMPDPATATPPRP